MKNSKIHPQRKTIERNKLKHLLISQQMKLLKRFKAKIGQKELKELI